MLVFTTLTFSQTSTFYMRAETFKAGEKNYKGQVVWDESTLTKCDILIKLDDQNATIFSKVRQTYRVISMTHKDDMGSQWYCIDDKGRYCNIYLISIKDRPARLAFVVEYSDYCWFYVCRESN